MGELLYLLIGFAFGCIVMLNRKEYREQKTYEQLDEQLRKELAVNKNLVASLKQDLISTKQKLQVLKEKR